MEKQDNLTPLNKILDKFFKNTGLSADLSLHIITKNWQNIVGTQLFEQVKPFKLDKEILIIKCKHQGWITTLSFYKNDMINKINDILKEKGSVKDIKFVF